MSSGEGHTEEQRQEVERAWSELAREVERWRGEVETPAIKPNKAQ